MSVEDARPGEHRITYRSPFSHSPNSDRFGRDPYYQHRALLDGLRDLLDTPFERNVDLRGAKICLQMSDDGLSVVAQVDPRGADGA